MEVKIMVVSILIFLLVVMEIGFILLGRRMTRLYKEMSDLAIKLRKVGKGDKTE